MPLQHLFPCLNQWGNPLNTKPFFYIWKHNRHLIEVPFHSKVSIWLKILCQLGFWLCRLRCTGSALSVLLSWKMVPFFSAEVRPMLNWLTWCKSLLPTTQKVHLIARERIWCYKVPPYELISAHWTGALTSVWVVYLFVAAAVQRKPTVVGCNLSRWSWDRNCLSSSHSI